MTIALVDEIILPSGITVSGAYIVIESAVYNRRLNDISLQIGIYASQEAEAEGKVPVELRNAHVPVSQGVVDLTDGILAYLKATVPEWSDATDVEPPEA